MKRSIFPTVSVVIAVRNEPEALSFCLSSIRRQDYEQKNLEIVVADGSADDLCTAVIKKYRGLRIPDKSGSPEKAKAVALEKAKGELVLFVDADNILPTNHWLNQMVSVLKKESRAIGCYPRRYAYIGGQSVLNRYFALIGINDPVAFAFGKADRQSYLVDSWDLAGKATDRGAYFLVEFDEGSAPTLGANGILVRRKTLAKAKVQPETFFHIDVHLDLIRQGYNRYAVIKNDIIHNSADDLGGYLKKRWRYMTQLYLRDFPRRRYLIYNDKTDRLKLIYYILRTFLVIPDLVLAIRGYLKIHDPAWFLHPVMNLVMILLYGAAVFRHFFQSAFRGRYHSIPS